MITDAVLWVSHPAMMLETLAGMTVLERQLFTLSRAGMRRVWIAAQKPRGQTLEHLRYPEDLQIFWVDMIGDSPSECHPPYLGISGDHVVLVPALREILSHAHERHTSYQDEAGRGVVQISPFRSDGAIQYDKRSMTVGSCHAMQNPPDLGPALPWLLRSAIKSSDGFMSRFFDRNVSLAVTRPLLNTPVRPNHMTVLSTLIGLAGAALLTNGTRPYMVAGTLLVWLHTLLDGCDGEIARLKFLESRWGGILDFWGDNLVHMALFVCMSVGVARCHIHDPLDFLAGLFSRALTLSPDHAHFIYILPGTVAALGTLGSAFVVFRHSERRAASKPAGPLFDGIADLGGPDAAKSRLARLETMLAQRDFIYLLIVLACIDRLEEFLWAAGVGTPLFFAILLYLKSREAGRNPS